jgi:hypothetical protein
MPEGWIVGILVLVLLIATFYPRKNQKSKVSDELEAYQVGLMTGMMGGSYEEAAIAQFALTRFEAQYKRKATRRDMAIVVSMIHAIGRGE